MTKRTWCSWRGALVAALLGAAPVGCGRGSPALEEPAPTPEAPEHVSAAPGPPPALLAEVAARAAELTAALGVHVTGQCALAGATPSEVEARTGLDARGVFHAGPDQLEVSPVHVRLMLGNLDLAEHVLARGRVTAVKSLETDHVILRGTLELDPRDARWLGLDSVRVAIKPAARGTYGREYRRELLFYKLGRHLEAAGLVPMVERDVALAPLEDALAAQLVPAQLERLTVASDAAGARSLHGSVQLWVEGYGPQLGHRNSSNAVLNWAASSLHTPRNAARRARLLAGAGADGATGARRRRPAAQTTTDPLWQGLSDMFVLDYLVFNSDRSKEAGSVRLPDGGQHLVMLDNGDTLMQALHKGRDTSLEHFEALGRFSPNVVERLATLDLEALEALLVDLDGELLVSRSRLRRLARRIGEARRQIERLARAADEDESVLFEQASRARPMRCR